MNLSDLNMQLAREFFELNLFYVLPQWRFEDGGRDTEASGALLFVEQPRPAVAGDIAPLLGPGDVRCIQRAMVEVRAWHADRLYASVVEASPVFARAGSQPSRAVADAVFNNQDYKIILVVSELSTSPKHQEQALQALKNYGIDHIIEFPTMLADMLRLISAQDNYAPSQTLQTMRLLKRYNFIRLQQMELFFPPARPDAPGLAREEKETTFENMNDIEAAEQA